MISNQVAIEYRKAFLMKTMVGSEIYFTFVR
jgi:hypothetical protein